VSERNSITRLFIISTFILIIHACSSANFDNRDEKLTEDEILHYAQDPDRFIAHAGGQVMGYNYTDSLEALDLSFSKGFQKFELDIIKTSDGYYVAAHDWKKWKKITGFTGDIPPTKQQFLNEKIYGRFTPLDMDKINDWFQSHPNSILVTDKVRDIDAFSNLFIDKNRLIMEIFEWKDIKNAQQAGIMSAMPSGNLLLDFEGDVIKYLLESNISEVAVSRNFINTNLELLIGLKKAGIRAYAFHVNKKKGKGTDYMICNESRFFYGMYSNFWQSGMKPKCVDI